MKSSLVVLVQVTTVLQLVYEWLSGHVPDSIQAVVDYIKLAGRDHLICYLFEKDQSDINEPRKEHIGLQLKLRLARAGLRQKSYNTHTKVWK